MLWLYNSILKPERHRYNYPVKSDICTNPADSANFVKRLLHQDNL